MRFTQLHSLVVAETSNYELRDGRGEERRGVSVGTHLVLVGVGLSRVFVIASLVLVDGYIRSLEW